MRFLFILHIAVRHVAYRCISRVCGYSLIHLGLIQLLQVVDITVQTQISLPTLILLLACVLVLGS